ncbi:type III secretion system needle filament subunit SctF [Aeromonas schubertii]|uniref:type III secretion system needle filament subunit SctF n=1 Tax=Aeromonas schubertii TaxID=652 RepID=UPI00067E7701|nr:type III secretion system needle filament subunit SctF [Aeromonas schubertii]KUE80861.1 type III export protein pscF [Aeromonas schubertii]MBZ6074331.1 type III secretion system needle filament subunit SctF [Aeromonas schubertii]QCG47968.1 EscF/YscF/HrpA family type III secretion system needle major subunit [Aeromonas schubertii]
MANNAFDGFSKATDITSLDAIAATLKTQADNANTKVNDAIKALKDNPDNPAVLADLQHSINKWSVIYNINSTVTRSFKDLMQGILQKI